ncbi:peptidase S10 serine carboxypeptidase [Acetobacter senegalensis]|uniref:Peptidase S10 serine carboxypeptidase n=1 Tax=Acetobacter senegalensis TaxID=446692 RepID=A0A0U5ES16_9PROT|nr:peptidase S10 [Acetobacter senegalensis]CEF40164.1 peptidase S10 serine carboxypeptidase [Acetobacter senegalensis]
MKQSYRAGIKLASLLASVSVLGAGMLVAQPAAWAEDAKPAAETAKAKDGAADFFTKPQSVTSTGSVTVHGAHIDYQAVSGTLIVHPKGWDDAVLPDEDKDKKTPAAASIFYVAYFKKGVRPENRPITFIYNGGPGSSTVWLHMGAFGPKKVVTADDAHTPAAPYAIVNNNDSLLDVSDLVFIDAPGTGYGRLTGTDKEKTFFGTDADARAFTDFIAQFLSRYGRYNSPKYLFGESYGTTRSAIVANQLADDKGIDLNGVILLSQILNYDNDIDAAQMNPSVDQPYVLALPSYAATAWYHKRIPNQPSDLKGFLQEVEHFALTDYTAALQDGNSITPEKRDAIAQKLHDYTGLPVDYIKKADLRVNGGEFEKTLLGDKGVDTGRLDSRFSGPTMDQLSQYPFYDPQSSAMSSAYIAAFNDYARNTLHYGNSSVVGDGYQEYKFFSDAITKWDFSHAQPNTDFPIHGAVNVLPDLASAMKHNTSLKVMLNQGYYDLGTPYFEGIYEMRHLPISHDLSKNIQIVQYESGHMVYAHQDSLAQLHDNVAKFITSTYAPLSGK